MNDEVERVENDLLAVCGFRPERVVAAASWRCEQSWALDIGARGSGVRVKDGFLFESKRDR